jgi:hypothetical protein
MASSPATVAPTWASVVPKFKRIDLNELPRQGTHAKSPLPLIPTRSIANQLPQTNLA